MPKKKPTRSASRTSPPPPRKAGKPDSPWAVLRGKELEWPGATLLALLLEAAHVRGLSIRELAEDHLGVSYSYFQQLRIGERPVPKLGPETLDKVAAFLNLPKVVVMLAAGQLSLKDFHQEPEVVEQYLEPALRFIQGDPKFGAYMPASVFGMTSAERQFIVMLYERASGKTLLPVRATLEETVENFRAIVSPD
jgi:hypothetical protein